MLQATVVVDLLHQHMHKEQTASRSLPKGCLSLSEIAPFSPDNVSLYLLALYQEVKLKIQLLQFPVVCDDINLAEH